MSTFKTSDYRWQSLYKFSFTASLTIAVLLLGKMVVYAIFQDLAMFLNICSI